MDGEGLPWNEDAPVGSCWRCPDCASWATLGGNAAFHATQKKHGAPTLGPIPQSYYLHSPKHQNLRDSALWWGPDRSGYSLTLEGAGVYGEEEAKRLQAESHGDILAVPCEVVAPLARRVVDISALRRAFPLLFLLLLALAIPAHAGEDAYYTMDLKDLALATPADRLHTHLCVTGTVAQVKHEADDDWHVKLCDDGLCIVLEIVPDIPVSRPAKGARITACGIERWNSWHGWRELHPVAYWKPAP
jgi:hypothetical protein